jgi:hypothetical protein
VTPEFHPTTPPRGSGKSVADFEPFVPIDPLNQRALLFLGVAQGMMLQRDWPYRAVTITMESPAVPGRLGLYGANHIDAITAVDQGLIDFSILNPSALLTMAYRGVGAFDRPHNVAAITVLPHHDQLGFAVSDRLGLSSLDEIAEARYPASGLDPRLARRVHFDHGGPSPARPRLQSRRSLFLGWRGLQRPAHAAASFPHRPTRRRRDRRDLR